MSRTKKKPSLPFIVPDDITLTDLQISALSQKIHTLNPKTIPKLTDFMDILDPSHGPIPPLVTCISSLISDWQAAWIRSNEESPALILPDHYSGQFRTIEIDFPWQYDDCGFKGWQDVKAYRIHPHYPKMTLANVDLSFLAINRATDPAGAHGWFWVTKDFLPLFFPILAARGWEYKQIFSWVKVNKAGLPSYGMGYWARNACEFLIFAILRDKSRKSAPSVPMLGARTSTSNYFSTVLTEEEEAEMEEEFLSTSAISTRSADAIYYPKGIHSAKPDEAYKIMASLSPGPRLSIFQRTQREGWECFGWEMEGQEGKQLS